MAVIWIVYAVQAYDTLIDLLQFHGSLVFSAAVAATVLIPYVLLWIAYGVRTLRSSGGRGN
jgi:ABC-type phosphate transport system permease subunit